MEVTKLSQEQIDIMLNKDKALDKENMESLAESTITAVEQDTREALMIEDEIDISNSSTDAYTEDEIDNIEDPALANNIKALQKARPYKKPKQYVVERSDISFGDDLPPGDSWMTVVQLPSGFKGYPKNAVILYKPYTYAELDTINDGSLSNFEKLKFMFQGIYTRNMDKNDIYLDDLIYILLLRKVSSLNSETFSVRYDHIDPITKERTQYSKVCDIRDLEFKDVKFPDLPARLTIGGRDVIASPVTMRNWKMLNDLHLEMDKYYLMASTFSNIPLSEAHALITNAIGKDILKLNMLDEGFNMGVLPIDFNYTHEGRTYSKRIVLTNIDTLVTPFCLLKTTPRDTIQFGLP